MCMCTHICVHTHTHTNNTFCFFHSHNTTRKSISSQTNRKKLMPIFPDQNVQRHSVTSHETARSLANDPSFSVGEVCILRSPGIAASPISLLSVGGVCGRSLNGGENNSLHWKANMLPLFSIMTLWSFQFPISFF